MTENTDRRSFIRRLSLGLSAAIFTPHIIAATWKDTLKYGSVNPDYLNEPLETSYIVAKEVTEYSMYPYGHLSKDLYGEWKFIPPPPPLKPYRIFDCNGVELYA